MTPVDRDNLPQTYAWLAGLVLLGGLVYLLAPVLTPFLVSALIAYLGDPLVDRLERKLSRSLAVTLVFLLLFALLGLLLILLLLALQQQLSTLVERLPVYIDWGQRHIMPWLGGLLGTEQTSLLDPAEIKTILARHWQEAGGLAGRLVQALGQSGAMVVQWLANLILIPVVSFYLLRDWDELMAHIRHTLPRRYEQRIVMLAQEADAVLGAFLRGQFLVMCALGLVYTLGLWFVGVELALFFGLLAGMVSFVPYLGFIIGILAAGGAALVQFHDVGHLLGVLAVFGIGQLLESFLLTPWLVGDRIGLHPVAVIFAVLAGGQLFGFVGVLIGLPAAAVVMVLLRHAHQHYLQSAAYGQADEPRD